MSRVTGMKISPFQGLKKQTSKISPREARFSFPRANFKGGFQSKGGRNFHTCNPSPIRKLYSIQICTSNSSRVLALCNLCINQLFFVQQLSFSYILGDHILDLGFESGHHLSIVCFGILYFPRNYSLLRLKCVYIH